MKPAVRLLIGGALGIILISTLGVTTYAAGNLKKSLFEDINSPTKSSGNEDINEKVIETVKFKGLPSKKNPKGEIYCQRNGINYYGNDVTTCMERGGSQQYKTTIEVTPEKTE